MKKASILLVAACGACSNIDGDMFAIKSAAIPVELWTGGDDALTQRLSAAVRDEFERSSKFKLAAAGTPDTLKVTIPTHVGWTKINGRVRVSYQLQLERSGRQLRGTHGVCWKWDLRACARQIIQAATTATAH